MHTFLVIAMWLDIVVGVAIVVLLFRSLLR
jgi:hypothetical protein